MSIFLDTMREKVRIKASIVEPLRAHLKRVKLQHEEDMRIGRGGVEMPGALARKYPNAEFEWGWQYVFPASKFSADPRSGVVRRHHLFETSVQKTIRRAAREAGIAEIPRGSVGY